MPQNTQAIFTFRTVKYIFLGKLHAIFLLLPALFWLVALLPDFYKNFRKNKTRYQLTNQRVIIETWSWWSAKIYQLKLQEIGDVKYEAFSDDSGTIHLIVNKEVSFHTRDFHTGSKRIYPTLELIADCAKVSDVITKQLAISRKR